MRRNSDNDNGANYDPNIGSDANNAREAEIVHAVDAGDGAIDAFGEGRKIGQCPNCSWHCNVCIYQGTVRLEDAANRSLRVINRRAVQNTDAINQVSVTVNANMDTLSTRLDQVVEKVESLESQVENWDDPNADKLSQNGNATVVLRSRVGLLEEEDDEDEFLNVLTTVDPFASQLPACRDENLTSFDNWAQKFRDLLDYAGTTWLISKRKIINQMVQEEGIIGITTVNPTGLNSNKIGRTNIGRTEAEVTAIGLAVQNAITVVD
ncbi:hypothetical protein niasHT_026470 [Heterodera trifolii]|uniref:Uncharacterized protein n=1 Tax=Heterodera trifolii TaxID=157864 RepID=A0ABD2JSE7_9BILA